MNRTSFPARLGTITPLVNIAPLVFLAALIYATPSQAQYMYLDTNGDGVHTGADVLNPTGSTQVAVWLDTQHDRDGSLQSCNSHTGAPHNYEGTPPDPGLNLFSYDIYLVVTHGTVVWGEYEDSIGFKILPNDEINTHTDTQIHITRFDDLGEGRAAGRYKLGTMTVSVDAGTPSIQFAPMVGGDYSAFGTECSATQEFPNSYVYGVDWFDADGILYDGTINHEPVFGQTASIRAIVDRPADQALIATDEDGQALRFSKLSGPDYATVTTLDPGTGQGSGSIHFAPTSADVGSADVVVRVSDGIFWDDRTIPVTVRPEIELYFQRDVTVTAGTASVWELQADNPLGENLTFYLASGPAFVTVERYTYGVHARVQPGVQDIGAWTATFGVTNGTIRSEKSFAVVVERNGEDHRPTVVTGGPFQGIVGHPVRFDGSRSSDPDGDQISFSWVFGDGSPGGVGAQVEHRYTSEGDYAVDLMVRDPSLFTVGSTTAHIVPVAQARAYLAGGPAAILAGAEHDVSVRIEPRDGLFEGGDIDPSTLSLALPDDAPAPSAARSIPAAGFDSGTEIDGDGNGLADRGVVFPGHAFATLLDAVHGHGSIELTIRGGLVGGGRFSAPVEVTVVRRGGSLSAGISPNPINPVGHLSFVTSRPGAADVKIFDVSGRLAHHAIDHAVLPAGYHEVTVGHGAAGEGLPSGIYYYRIETPEAVARGRFAIVR